MWKTRSTLDPLAHHQASVGLLTMLRADATNEIGGVECRACNCYSVIMRIALYQPEIPGNVGAVLRLAACFDVGVDIIEPCGFVFSDKRLKRAGMDYADHVRMTRHMSWDIFLAQTKGRLVLLSSKASTRLPDYGFAGDDILLMGQESAGVPNSVRALCDAQVRIPMIPAMRSLNIAVATGIALSEALRQTGGLPE